MPVSNILGLKKMTEVNSFMHVFKKYRFLMKNTGFGVSEYSFVIPEVGMSVYVWSQKRRQSSTPQVPCVGWVYSVGVGVWAFV